LLLILNRIVLIVLLFFFFLNPVKSYCLKVKEMDDEEYSCIVSTSTVA